MSTNIKLYEISDQYLQLAHQLADLDLDAQTVADTIEASGLTDDFAVKAQNIEMVCRNLTKDIPAIDTEIKRLTALKKHRERVADGLHEYLLFNMQQTGIQKIEAPLFSISIRTNPPSVDVFDESQVPNEYMVPKYTISKTLIKEALSAGKEIPGARMTQTQRVAIK